MQRNNQQHEQFLRAFGALLAAHTRHGHALPQHQALLHLAEHVSSARRHHRLSRAALAQKTGKAEAEIYALEQGLLPYGELDVRFLHKLATALDEELETLLLLLGRPALVHALRAQAALPPNHRSRLRRQPATERSATGSKQRDNLLARDWWANVLHKGYLNLIDSVQEGRLFWYVRPGQRAWLPITLFVCLLCICVGTYSFIGRFDAQSTLPSYAMTPSQTAVLHSFDLQSRLPVSSTTPVALAIPDHKRASLVKNTTDVVDDERGTPMSLFVQPLPADAQLCDFRTMGKFALCRV